MSDSTHPAPRPTSETRSRSGGVWIARHPLGEKVLPFATEIDALRHAVKHGSMEVVWVPYSQDARTYTTPPDAPRPPTYRSAPASEGAQRTAT
jgi:hypothetical protein